MFAADIIFFQTGVGALAGSGCSYFLTKQALKQPKLVCLEPLSADCFLQSIKNGERIKINGNLDSIMAGLNCGTPSMIAWPIIKENFDLFLAIPDNYALEAMRILYYPQENDQKIISGETGASGLAGLIALIKANELHELREKLNLNEETVILLINTEGDTDPENFKKIVKLMPNV